MPNIYDLDTPTLLVDCDRLERNIATMACVVREHGTALRPHTKTHKTPEIARMQLDAGASGLTVAKLGEAEVLADAGGDDIFIANEIVGSAKVERLLNLARQIKLTVGVDSIETARPIGDAANRDGLRIPVRIEVDTGLGRAGTRSVAETLELARFITEQPGLELAGIFTHEGHLYKIPNDERAQAAANVAAILRETAAGLAAQGTPAVLVSAGSTPGAALLAGDVTIGEVRPGVYVFNDRIQQSLGVPAEDCALSVLATVISVRPDGRVLIDAGTKSLASDSPFPDKTMGEILNQPALTFIGASEEHGHLQAESTPTVKVGDKVRVLMNHACTCCNLHETLTVHRGETVEAVWQIAGRGKIR